MHLRLALTLTLSVASAAFALPSERFVRRVEVPDAEKAQRSSEAVIRMRAVLRDTIGKLEEARRTKDIVKLNCVNEKLTQVKGLLRVSEQADVTLQEALAKSDTETSRTEFEKVEIARTKVEQLRAEVEECIGQLAFLTDANLAVEVETPTNLPGNDPTIPTQLPPAPSRPPPSSPQQ